MRCDNCPHEVRWHDRYGMCHAGCDCPSYLTPPPWRSVTVDSLRHVLVLAAVLVVLVVAIVIAIVT